ncbi:ABC transporter permease [Flavihumibacter profundi]|uniref:ABC transporter permease n=1 Tax=Flavihumibacter profundi TaxID=2716883 RepID=UPI001CC7E6EB|nr:FtsX-like permease family protein [Flavihumibacter profundi]MBZ5858984.1 ABC transporter permease [Flavihumibacter profundi]
MILSIAWRNLWRNPLRSLVIIGSVMTGLLAGIFILAFFRGLINEQINTGISQQLSHIQVHNPVFRELDEEQYTINNVSGVLSALEKDDQVAGISQRLVITAMASSAYTASGVSIYGVEPLSEAAVTGLNKRIKEGHYLENSASGQILMGRKLAKKLHLGQGSKVILTFQDKNNELIAAAFRITGIFEAANSNLEENNVFVKKNELDSLTLLGGRIHELAILLKDNKAVETTAFKLRNLNTGNKVETWKQLSPEIRMMIDSFSQYMVIIIGIILIALVFGIVNTMLMAVLERYRELGVLMAIGLNKRKIFSMIMTETLLMTILGCLAGLPLSWLTVYLTGRNGINLSRFSEGLAMYGYGTRVYPQLELSYYWQVGGMAIVAALLASVYPSLKALQLKPATAIRKI